jgi:6-phosphogluconolactonase (cycloisomerase 2 family)
MNLSTTAARQRSAARAALIALAAALACALALVTPPPRLASASPIPVTITVNTTTIEDDPNSGKCSLYEALSAAFLSKSNGESKPYHECSAGGEFTAILFGGAAAGGTLTFPSKPNDLQLPMIIGNVSIVGPVTIDGNGANTDHHIFWIGPGGTLNLANMVLRNGHTSGGGAAILDNNQGTVNIAGVSFQGNIAEGDGGAINSNGTLNILASNFVGNKAQGIYSNNTNNPATGYGGAIRIDGSDKLKLAASNFSGNIADKGGAALFSGANAAEVSDDIFSGNIVDGTGTNNTAPQGGGAILNDADSALTVVRTAFSGNLAPTSNGGALFAKISSTIVISETSFQGNIAGSPATGGNGGAIYNAGADLTLLQDTFLNNAAVKGNGGALANDRHGTATIANSSFTANAAANGDGGAIHNTNTQQGGPVTTIVAKNVTFSSNAALNSSGHGGAVFNDSGHSFTLGNSIVDNSVVDNCTGTITSLGHNLDSANTCGFNQAGDQHNTDPKLDSPSFNGGPIVSLLTQKLLAGSAAIDKGDPSMCAADPVNNVDQRGDTRPKGSACDVGSFESDPLIAGYGSTPVQPGPIALGNATVNGVDTVDTTFTIFETGNATLTVSNPQFGGANASEFSIKSPAFPLNIPDGGADQTVILSCKPGAVGQRTATLTLTTNDSAHSSVTYNLTCNGTAQPAPSFASNPTAPGPIGFGDVTVNTTANFSLAISDTGDAALTVSTSTLGGANSADFKVVTSFPLNIAAGTLKTVQVQCKPASSSIRTATLTLATNDQNRPTVVYNLACEGQPVPPPILDEPGESVPYPHPASPTYGPYGVAVSSDGKNVYAADYGHDLVAVFTRDTTTGNITWKQNIVNNSGGVSGMAVPYLVTVSPDGQNVYVSAGTGDSIITFKRSPSDGTLTFVKKVSNGDQYGFCLPTCQQLQALDGAYGIALSPDGRYGYVSGINDNKVIVLDRDQTTGALELQPLLGPVQVYTSQASAAYGIAMSPDGANLYLAGYLSNSLEVLDRNATDGKLSFIERHINGQGGVSGLNGVFRVAVSPDGAYVYTASFNGDALTVFKRDQSTGKLTFVTTYQNGVGSVSGLDAASSIAFSPDGARLFATGYFSNAVAVFDRDAVTGLLTEKQVITRNGAGVPALGGARDVAVSSDGRTVYATGFSDNQVVALHMANPTPALESLEPASAQAGGATFTLTVNGQSFIPGSKVRWNGASRPTTFVNNTELKAQIAAADIASAGSADVTVFNPTPGGGVSNVLKFTITAPGQNPVPSIDTLVPASAPAGGAAFTLTINGSNFISSSKVRWNGTDRPTSFVNSTQLTAQIAKADIAQPGPAGLTVVNPGPGGGTSNAATFDVAAPGENPTPAITRISPNTLLADVASAADITLLIDGSNFTADSQAQWNGKNRPTTFVSSTRVKMIVTATDLALGGQGSITVVNPAPGGGTSNTATFTIYTIRLRIFMPMIKR